MISSFRGKYRFLSNFWLVPVESYGAVYPSVEHAYQAAKSLDPSTREVIRLVKTPGEAKRLGKIIRIRPDWERLKEMIMADLLRRKFQFSELREKLLATQNEELIEGNYWHDTFWGVCYGQCHNQPGHSPIGDNKLGKLLTRVRDEIKADFPKN